MPRPERLKTIVLSGVQTLSDRAFVPPVMTNPSVRRVILISQEPGHAERVAAVYRGRTRAQLTTARDISEVDERVDGVIIKALAQHHRRVALDAINRLGAGVLLETVGRSLEPLIEIVRAAARAGVHLQMPLHYPLAASEPLAWLAADELRPTIDSRARAEFDLSSPERHAGRFPVLGLHAIPLIEAIAGWVVPDRVRTRRQRDDACTIALAWDSAPLRTATINIAGGVTDPREWLKLRASSAHAELAVSLPTTKTEPSTGLAALRTQQARMCEIEPVTATWARQSTLWISSLGSEPSLPVDGERALLVQAVFDAALESLGSDGREVAPKTHWMQP